MDLADFTNWMNIFYLFAALSGSIRQLIEQNNQVLGQISANISSMKVSNSTSFSKRTFFSTQNIREQSN